MKNALVFDTEKDCIDFIKSMQYLGIAKYVSLNNMFGWIALSECKKYFVNEDCEWELIKKD